jgi:hypothetical protein
MKNTVEKTTEQIRKQDKLTGTWIIVISITIGILITFLLAGIMNFIW